MPNRQTSKSRRQARSQVLEVRVMSPRIAWLGFLKITGKLTKIACVLGLLAAICWGVWQSIQHAFYKNPDFRLQVLKLNPNNVMDEGGLANLIGINPTPNLFEINVEDVTKQLESMPAILSARVERHLPGTLMVTINPRIPRAWIVCDTAGLTQTHQTGAMLVDIHGVAYPCPDLQLKHARTLPVIQIPHSEHHPVRAGHKVTQPELAHCFHLLKSACEVDGEAIHWIKSIEQINAWSMKLVTLDGTTATFGIGDHPRQIQNLRAAMDHASQKGYAIDTINLIPKRNIPITVRAEAAAPRAVPVPEPNTVETNQNRRSRDLKNLLNRN